MSFSANPRYNVGDRVLYYNKAGKRAHSYAQWTVVHVSVLRDRKTRDKYHLYTIEGLWAETHRSNGKTAKTYKKNQRMVHQCRASMLRLDKAA